MTQSKRDYYGKSHVETISTDYQLKWPHAKKWLLTASVPGLDVKLPDIAALPRWVDGGTVFCVTISGSNSITLTYFDGTPLGVMAPDDSWTIYLDRPGNRWLWREDISGQVVLPGTEEWCFILSGENPTAALRKETWRHDPITDVWIQDGDSPFDFRRANGDTMGDQALVMGGLQGQAGIGSNYSFDPPNWVAETSASGGLNYDGNESAAYTSNLRYTFGGAVTLQTAWRLTLEYNRNDDTWTSKALQAASSHFGTAHPYGDFIFKFSSHQNTRRNEIMRYDVGGDSFTTLGTDLNYNQQQHGSAVNTDGDIAYIMAGNDGTNAHDDTNSYDMNLGTVTDLAKYPINQFGLGGSRARDRLFFSSGNDTTGTNEFKTYEYDIDLDSFLPRTDIPIQKQDVYSQSVGLNIA